MTAHLLGLGHRRIGFIAGHPSYATSGQRMRGYAKALGDAGIALDPALVREGSYDFASGAAAAEELLALDPPLTAIFASSDDMAAGALTAAHRRGLAVPRQLSVAGFDDTALAGLRLAVAHHDPPADAGDGVSGGRSAARPCRRAGRTARGGVRIGGAGVDGTGLLEEEVLPSAGGAETRRFADVGWPDGARRSSPHTAPPGPSASKRLRAKNLLFTRPETTPPPAPARTPPKSPPR